MTLINRSYIYIYRRKMTNILKEFVEESVASRIFSCMSHPVVDVFRANKLVREVIKYPTHINSFSDWYLNEFQNEQWHWTQRWQGGKQIAVRRKIEDGRKYMYR